MCDRYTEPYFIREELCFEIAEKLGWKFSHPAGKQQAVEVINYSFKY